ncbi:MAG: PHP domain-containing protein [Candidatus Omnitrophica bacterium]|nr:PHP domain-containing protein [Candidatus Omnitrophota bacterium]
MIAEGINRMTEKEKNLVDLHVHTLYSDGLFSPEEVVEKACELGLKAIAITDHDCIDAIAPCRKAAEGKDLEIVGGVEISAESADGDAIHILGYCIDEEDTDLMETLGDIKADRILAIKKMISLLRENDVFISEEKFFDDNQKGAIGRLNLARSVVRENKNLNIKKVFDRFIGDRAPCYVKHKNLDYKKTIDLIKNAGGVAVLAHPGTMGSDEYIPDYVKAGLRGIEVFHLRHRPDMCTQYSEIAKQYGLLETGGSDCHGGYGNKALIGKVKIGYEIIRNLMKESRNYGCQD